MICLFSTCLRKATKHGQHQICRLIPPDLLLLRFTTSLRLVPTTLPSIARNLEVHADRSEAHNRADHLRHCTRCSRLITRLHHGIVFLRRCIRGCPLMLQMDAVKTPMFILCLSLLERLVLLLLFRARRLLSKWIPSR